MDRFRVEVISQTPNPQQVIYAALHQDYTENFVFDERDSWPSEAECGEVIVKRLLAGDRGHYGPLEHPQIIFNCGYFPHSVMQQARTHRVGVSFDVQCLAADTLITFVDCEGSAGKKNLSKTIGELYDLWTNGEKAIRSRSIRGLNGEPPGEYRRDCKQRIRKMRLRVLNEQTGLFEVGHIKEVMCSGIQPVYKVTLEDGKTLECTANHRLFTPDGWQTMKDAVGLITQADGKVVRINQNSHVMCNGVSVTDDRIYTDKSWLETKIAQGLTIKEIADLSNCSPNTVKAWTNKHGLSSAYSGGRFPEGHKPWNYNPNALYRDQNWLVDQLEKGLHADEMATLANCSIEVVKKWVYAYGLSLNKRKPGSDEPWNKGKGGYELNLSEDSRQKRIENAKIYTQRGAESNFWKGGTSTERQLIGAWTRQIAPQVHKKFDYICQKCAMRGGSLHAHHLIPVFANQSLAYDFDNLVTFCKECHEYIHQNNLESEFYQAYSPILDLQDWEVKPKPKGRKLQSHAVKVKSVEYVGQQMTYDLEVDGEWHNFVANGLVVHNSLRYTGNQFLDAAVGKKDIEDIFYLRPVDYYTDREGKKYYYSPEQRAKDLEWCLEAAKRYKIDFDGGMSEEHARGKLPFDYRQHFVVSFNLRSFLHFSDLRNKKNAQLEIQKLCEMMWPHFESWAPGIAKWYTATRLGKARLAP